MIPKVNSPKHVNNYCPINLCNVLYKIITKMLTNRLKLVLPTVISPNQSAFVSRRLITDNILAAYETHTMYTQMFALNGYMAVKLDMSKAHDRV